MRLTTEELCFDPLQGHTIFSFPPALGAPILVFSGTGNSSKGAKEAGPLATEGPRKN